MWHVVYDFRNSFRRTVLATKRGVGDVQFYIYIYKYIYNETLVTILIQRPGSLSRVRFRSRGKVDIKKSISVEGFRERKIKTDVIETLQFYRGKWTECRADAIEK